MNLFFATRLRLTILYIIISYAMLAFFTFAVMMAFDRTFQVVTQGIIEQGRGIVLSVALQDDIQAFQQSFIQRLLLFDVLIAIAAGLASYILSGRTLRPIQRMVEQQQAFAADASHELRTPLANMTMEIAAYRQQYKPKTHLKDLLDSLESEAQRMASIVSGLLSLVRVDSDKSQLAPVNLSSIIQASLLSTQARFQQAKLQSVNHIPADLQCLGQADELRQLALILLDNAILYSHPHTTVTTQLKQQGDHLLLTVNNHGPLIPAKELPRLFNRFYRGQGVTVPGTGLGLAIAQAIVQRHQGTIAVASSLSQGTTFRVVLPTIPQPAAELD